MRRAADGDSSSRVDFELSAKRQILLAEENQFGTLAHRDMNHRRTVAVEGVVTEASLHDLPLDHQIGRVPGPKSTERAVTGLVAVGRKQLAQRGVNLGARF